MSSNKFLSRRPSKDPDPHLLIPRKKCPRCNVNVTTRRIKTLIENVLSLFTLEQLAEQLGVSAGQASRLRKQFQKDWPFVKCPNCKADVRISENRLTLDEIETAYLRDKYSLRESELAKRRGVTQQAISKQIRSIEEKVPHLKRRLGRKRQRSGKSHLRNIQVVSPDKISYCGPQEAF